ncbi:MAG TPA: carbon-nitrogen hydrolase family protein [Anaerolineae bacterium]|nr:carbon-nitrogen hydrolase family protein [Anaerolineae bacterium]
MTIPPSRVIALIPLKTHPRRPDINLREFERRLEETADAGADLVIFPECTLMGYLYEPADLERFAEPVPGPTVDRLARLARKHHVAVCFGLLERTPAGVYNTAILLDRRGEIALKHRKINEQPPFLRGQDVRGVDTEFGRVSILICGDLFADDARAQLDASLDLVLVPMARAFAGRSPDPDRWEREERQAYLNAAAGLAATTAIVNALEVGVDEPSFGGAMLVGPQGQLLAESPHGSDAILLWKGV